VKQTYFYKKNLEKIAVKSFRELRGGKAEVYIAFKPP
jgi:hypothetical protein